MASVASASNSICGIDVGSENCYVAVARSGGIEILLNDYSQRSTPAYIGFGGSQREIGVSAKQKQMMNLKNTCFAPSLIVGKAFSQLNRNDIPYDIIERNDQVLISVEHDGEKQKLTPTQVLAMLFTKLRQISGNAIDCVINCPNYFTFAQKRALLDGAIISGLNPLKIIHDMTATALYYGFYRGSSTHETSIIVFVDCGHTSTQASIVLFNHKESSLRVLDAEYEPSVGGKDFDEVLAQHFIKEKNLKLNARAHYRLVAECEKLKKQMSANSNELPINIECLHDDKDFSARLDRTKFEELSESLIQKIMKMFDLTLKRATENYQKDFVEKHGPFKVDSVEIVGGTSRIPVIKRLIKDIFGVEPSTTLNADEAVARGCALQCAILSPTYKVAKELQIIDSLAYQINFKYRIVDSEDFKMVNALYPRGHQFPFLKQISLSIQKLPAFVAFDYVTENGISVEFASYEICEPQNVNVSEHLQKNPIKLRVRVDENGLITIISASVSYEKPLEAAMDQSESVSNENNGEKMDVDENADKTRENQAPETEPKRKSKPKPESISLELKATNTYGRLSKPELDKFLEFESNMILADKNWKEKTDAKNALEEFIYEWRDRLENGGHDAFIESQEKEDFKKILSENEDWLFQQEEVETLQSKSVYDERTTGMSNRFAKNILFRRREYENRGRYFEKLGQRIQQAKKLEVQEKCEEEVDELNKFRSEIDAKINWHDDAQGKLISLPTYMNPPITCEEIEKQSEAIQDLINKLQNSRNRRAEQKRKAIEEAEKKAAQAKKVDEQQQQQQQQQPQEAKKQQAGDDIDASKNEKENGPTTNTMEVDNN